VTQMASSDKLRIAVAGAGFWAAYQIAGWLELGEVEVCAIYNRTRAKAESLASRFGIRAVYDDPQKMLLEARPDALDIITSPDTHEELVGLAVACGVPVICQKPMSTSLESAERMVEGARAAGVPFIVHENWRWQRPIRQLQQLLASGMVGKPFRGRLEFNCSFPVFDNQPFLRELDRFIITDVGSHVLDVARFLFGEFDSIYCRAQRIHGDIKGEDVATIVLARGDLTCTCELSYASRLEHERFPETYIRVEADAGALELGPDYWVRATTEEGTHSKRYPPRRYSWVDPAYELVHSSIVDCHRDILAALRGERRAETDAEDNIKTLRLVFAAYESAQREEVIRL